MNQTLRSYPRLVVSALRGGSGKTLLSLGITRALKDMGKDVVPFKKGPDYIDAGWLALAAKQVCRNLDTYMIPASRIRADFLRRARSAHVSVIEGNRGLYDGIDIHGTTSTAELAKLLGAPVVLCLDCTKSTRTMAAAVLGCQSFDPDVNLAGVILNKVAGPRHESILTRTIETACRIPVLGAFPRLGRQYFPERHMGLVPTPEHDWAEDSVLAAAKAARRHLNLEALLELAKSDPLPAPDPSVAPAVYAGKRPAIGVFRDSAFQFYYPENLEALENAGAKVIFLSPFTASPNDLDRLCGLYIGGGFPETHAEQLAAISQFSAALKAKAEMGLPIYAECGGLMYLGQSLEKDGKAYPMAGVLPLVFGFSKRPKGHGYTRVKVRGDNPFYPKNTVLKGHEFHYSSVVRHTAGPSDFVFEVQRGAGIVEGLDGICVNNVLATYTHIHAGGVPAWAPALVRAGAAFMKKHQIRP